VQKAMGYMVSWLSSSAINNCNTVAARSLPSGCAMNYWGSLNIEAFMYWGLYSKLYVNLQGSSSCVYKTLHYDYAAFKKR